MRSFLRWRRGSRTCGSLCPVGRDVEVAGEVPDGQGPPTDRAPDPNAVTKLASLVADAERPAFLVGSDTGFPLSGDIYTMRLPNGEPIRRTRDARLKYGVAFSPDGSEITYTAADANGWSTMAVPVRSGEPKLLMRNAAGLTWLDPHHALFSESLGAGLHMGLVVGSDRRENAAPARPSATVATTARVPAIAVLPFENLGPADQEYFAVGMTDEITSRLSAVSGLGVIASRATRRYAGTRRTMPVPLLELVRSAASETEQYTRVVLGRPGPDR